MFQSRMCRNLYEQPKGFFYIYPAIVVGRRMSPIDGWGGPKGGGLVSRLDKRCDHSPPWKRLKGKASTE